MTAVADLPVDVDASAAPTARQAARIHFMRLAELPETVGLGELPEPVEVALVTPAFGTGMHSDGVSGNVSDSEKVKRVTVALAEATPDSASTTAAPLLTTTRLRRG